MPVPFKVKAIFEYKSEEPDDLNFAAGQIITVIEEEDADWYTGEYEGPNGKLEGLFPRNFVEKYEPAIPSRPVRNVSKSAQNRPTPTEAPPQPDPTPASPPQDVSEPKTGTPAESRSTAPAPEPTVEPALESKPQITKKPPPPVAEKPASSSFRDRIAAFNKPAAAPVAPFKPSGTASSSSFIKKPFVAPPPSRNSYVPPPSQAPPPTKIYRREEDPEMVRQESDDAPKATESSVSEAGTTEEQPKPTSLKDRIALLQQQQLEQAQRAADKKKVKKTAPPPPQRADSAEHEIERIESTEAPLVRQETENLTTKKSLDSDRDAALQERDEAGTPEPEVVIPTVVSPPPRELVSDTNDADESGAADTEDAQETSTEEDRRKLRTIKAPLSTAAEPTSSNKKESAEEAAGEGGEDEEDTEEEEDPDVRRRRELRERMAKMSGGMGMMGMFGPPGGMPVAVKKPKSQKAEKSTEAQHEEETVRAPPVPIMALPGMASRAKHEEAEASDDDDTASPTPMESTRRTTAEEEDYLSHQQMRTSTERSGPTSNYERAAPPPPPRESRALPTAPRSAPTVPEIPQSPPGRSSLPPPPPPPPTRDETMDSADLAITPTSGRSSMEDKVARQSSTKKDSRAPPGAPPPPPVRTATNDSFTSTHSAHDKRMSRAPPPPPTAAPMSPQSRAPPPPPPPGQPPSRSATGGSKDITASDDDADEVDEDSEEEVTEYDGDYDTDIASSAKNKGALKGHNRDSSGENEGTFTDDAHDVPAVPPNRAVPPLPPSIPPRDVPPPPPSSAPRPRQSTEAPRAAPPPIPNIPVAGDDNDDEYDPYRYSAPQPGVASPPAPPVKSPPTPYSPSNYEEDDLYDAPSQPPPPMPARTQQPPPVPAERVPPPPPPTERAAPPPPSAQPEIPMMTGALGPATTSEPTTKYSVEINRTPTVSRRSLEQSRPSADFGFMASDVDLAEGSLWWTHESTPPPSIAARTDVLYEVESNTTTKRGGKTTVNRDVYVLYIDYSQTTINVSFDPNDPTNASISQSHQRPPPPPRQDQLESVSHSFGNKIHTAASQAYGTTIADGSAQGFIATLLQPFQGAALMPIGNRSFGATVYSNLANASTQQFDEIRAGDIITFRNAKFSGHKGGLHTKYTMEAGQPGRDHVAVVIDWDGTKKKIRAWEQGRDDKKGSRGKVKEESFRIGDLKSGEVRVWRVMGRGWIGWDSS